MIGAWQVPAAIALGSTLLFASAPYAGPAAGERAMPSRPQVIQSQAGATTGQSADELLAAFVGFFDGVSALGSVGFESAFEAFSEMMTTARKAKAAGRIDVLFFDRYARLLRISTLVSIPDKSEILLPITRPEIQAFVRDVTGRTLREDSRPIPLGEVSAALSAEVINLKDLAGRLVKNVPGKLDVPGKPVSNASAAFNEGILLFNLGDHAAEAEAQFRKAIKLDPKLADAHFHLALALFVQSSKPQSEAKVEFLEYLKLEPKGTNAAAAKEYVAKIK